jgi:hypothetical protein
MAYKDRFRTPGLANATSNLEAPKHPSTEAQDLHTVMENQQNLVEVGVMRGTGNVIFGILLGMTGGLFI